MKNLNFKLEILQYQIKKFRTELDSLEGIIEEIRKDINE